MPNLTRRAALVAIVAALEQQLLTAQTSADAARDSATNAETKQEGKYDTRAIEAGYLAGAQSRRITEMEITLGRYRLLPKDREPPETVNGPALVALRGEVGDIHYFVGPGAAGLRVSVDGVAVKVLTPASPLGTSLVGAEVGDEVSLPDGTTLELISIQ